MNLLEALEVFVHVADLGSFTRAANNLGLPKASASTAVQQLENTLGTQLLYRTTRKVELTQDGRACYERARDLLADTEELQSLFQQSPQALRGRLRVDLPTRLARHVLLPGLPDFLARHPALELELSCSDRRVDLVREGFDCVLRVGTLNESSLIARPLGRLRVGNYASADYLRQYGTPLTPADLDNHRLIHYTQEFGGKPFGWEYPDGKGYATRPMAGVLTVNNTDAYETACLAGLGLIQAPAAGLQEHLARGTLVEVLPGYPAEPMPVALVYAQRRNLPRRVRSFMDWVAETLAPALLPL